MGGAAARPPKRRPLIARPGVPWGASARLAEDVRADRTRSKETRTLSLMCALRVNSGTEQIDHPVPPRLCSLIGTTCSKERPERRRELEPGVSRVDVAGAMPDRLQSANWRIRNSFPAVAPLTGQRGTQDQCRLLISASITARPQQPSRTKNLSMTEWSHQTLRRSTFGCFWRPARGIGSAASKLGGASSPRAFGLP